MYPSDIFSETILLEKDALKDVKKEITSDILWGLMFLEDHGFCFDKV